MDFGANLMQHKKYFAFPSNAVLVTVIAPFLLLPLPLLVSGKVRIFDVEIIKTFEIQMRNTLADCF